jgi:protoheme IX farnesyltransferase
MIDYLLLMKPGILIANLITFIAGFALAGGGFADWSLFLCSFLGLAGLISAGCTFNNYLDRFADQRMTRTAERPLADGRIQPWQALVFGTVLFLAGNLSLFFGSTTTALLVANFGFVVYVLLYSLLKYKTAQATLIGSFSGAAPPLVGYCAVSASLDAGGILLFLFMICWQMPHFYAISLWRQADYARANVPVWPQVKGVVSTQWQMLGYVAALIPLFGILMLWGYLGPMLGGLCIALSLCWLLATWRGFQATDTVHWGRQMFRLSLVLINVLSVGVVVEALWV